MLEDRPLCSAARQLRLKKLREKLRIVLAMIFKIGTIMENRGLGNPGYLEVPGEERNFKYKVETNGGLFQCFEY